MRVLCAAREGRAPAEFLLSLSVCLRSIHTRLLTYAYCFLSHPQGDIDIDNIIARLLEGEPILPLLHASYVFSLCCQSRRYSADFACVARRSQVRAHRATEVIYHALAS